ncbi:MAG: thiamine phosphate synthase [Acidobacteriota bacterium]
MGLILPRVYPITDRRLSGLSHAEQVWRLIRGGATLIQLREKDASPRDFYRQAADALEIARQHNVKIIINDRVDLVLALRADGVHLGQTDLPPEAARHLLGAAAIIGFSTHDPAQVLAATKLPVNYIAFGPIFATSTKENPDSVAGLTALQQARQAAGAVALVAIGGINGTNAQAVLGAGADSLAMISDLLTPAELIEENMRKMLASL